MSLIVRIKRFLYFPLAYYFRFFAQIQLFFWKPRIIVITGSSGKTTLLHLLESQLGERAEYSHQANSSFGIPFHILGLKRKTLTPDEWPTLFLKAPFKAFPKIHSQNLYIVETDCDRVGEGKFLSTLLKPEVTIWLSSTKTHSVNFPKPIEENIANEFAHFLKYTSKKAFVNEDSRQIKNQLFKTNADIEKISLKDLESYLISEDNTQFKIRGKIFKFKFLLPKEFAYQLETTIKILSYLRIPLDATFKNFKLPPGRSSKFGGIKNTTIIDSSYNADLESMKVMLKMFDQIPRERKWAVLGDMVEQGKLEKSEHEALAKVINLIRLDKVILVGPRLSKYTYPKLKSAYKFDKPKDALNFLKKNLKGGEIVFFKGARFLEGIIEHLLENKDDVKNLCRQEKVWQDRKRAWGL